MKIVHLKKKDKAEASDPELDVKALEQLLKEQPSNEKAYDRLMVLYRKLKEPKKELKIINAAIKVFEEKYVKRQPGFNKKIETISRALRKATGLADKKGNNLFEPGELTRWKKRKALLQSKMKNKKD